MRAKADSFLFSTEQPGAAQLNELEQHSALTSTLAECSLTSDTDQQIFEHCSLSAALAIMAF